ncbi:hypothetical protein CI109_105911 [Kwoniella shandongensis]|uniref:Uncharacterized protein n=1 Tax=Kwoniella shandongensis TaxID=1734106 RepID=A0A5M6BVL3_9TREE|nr:uncharacterized protein CI109_006659 [Kwoniella shandongensis]KAA5525019.1 hypothetical protein CI109_006659 [Kwoniella shandongensis]
MDTTTTTSSSSSSSSVVPVDLSASSSSSTVAGPSKRAKTGCITCRLRKKRCDEAKPICATCSRLGIECLGYGAKRPKWLREKDNAKKAKLQIKQTVSSKRASRTKTSESVDLEDHSEGSRRSSDNSEINGSNNPPDPVGGLVHDESFERGTIPEEGQWLPPLSAPAATNWELPSGSTSNGGSLTDTIGSLNAIDAFVPIPHTTASFNPTPYSDHSTALATYPFPAGPSLPPPVQGVELDALWSSLFGLTDASLWATVPAHAFPPVATPPEEYTYLTPSPTAGPSMATDQFYPYFQHYLTHVLPLQYKLMGSSRCMGELVIPLASARSDVLASVSSLAALHLASQRARSRRLESSSSGRITPINGTDGNGRDRYGIDSLDVGDEDAIVAASSHNKSIAKLQFLSPQDLVSEAVIIPVLFAISYHLFSGGTTKSLRDILSVAQKCLSASLSLSPELLRDNHTHTSSPQTTPWARFPHLIQHMIWTDTIASVSQNKTSKMLPAYRKLLDHPPVEAGTNNRPLILMDKVMGADSTTLLAMVETVALSEWKEKAEKEGSLSYKELLTRASDIERLLEERAWRESHLGRSRVGAGVPGDGGPSDEIRSAMSDIFHSSAKVLLATVVNGPYPRVPEVEKAVTETLEALLRLDVEHPGSDIHRALVLPITIAGCHSDDVTQQAYFRQCFDRLGPEAKVFGNTGPALELMEEVWKRRAEADRPDVRVCWRETVVDMGWEDGILMI